MEELRKTGDGHQIEALDGSGLYIFESLYFTIIGSTIKVILSTYFGPEALTCVFEVVSMVYFEHTEQMKADLKFIKLVDFRS